jgi:Mg-chelatase subunit ChlD
MLEESPSKLSRAAHAVGVFASSLRSTDQAALITFDSDAKLNRALTVDMGALRESLNQIVTGQSTRIDLGIQLAHEELMSERGRPTARRVMIVLTDGRPNPVGPEEVVRRAEASKQAGVVLFTIGLGADVDSGLLTAAASEESLFYPAPSADDLEKIYLSLLAQVPCDPSTYWGRR